MLDFGSWSTECAFPAQPWLILGKGPSFEGRDRFDLSGYNVLALNHTVREVPADISLMIDFDVAEACADRLAENARWLLMPRFPHVDFAPGPPLEEQIARSSILQHFESQGRLVAFDLNRPSSADGPVIDAPNFSGEAALDILGHLGARTIRSLGVDGGKSYAPGFSKSTLLANRQPSFDVQFSEFLKIILRHKLDYCRLTEREPIRVYVGSDATQWLAARVLEHSIRKYASQPVEVHHMIDLPIRLPQDPEQWPRTPFSFYRFAIPQLAGHRGRAIYVDSDMLVFHDIAELWDTEFEGASLLCAGDPSDPRRKRQFSVMLLDCARLGWDVDDIVTGLDEEQYDYAKLMYDFCIVKEDQIRASLPERWNSLEKYVAGETALLHYTDMPKQPYVSRKNRNGALWIEAFREAVREGFLTEREIQAAVRKEFVRPTLLSDLHPWQVWRHVQDLFHEPHRRYLKRMGRARNKALAARAATP